MSDVKKVVFSLSQVEKSFGRQRVLGGHDVFSGLTLEMYGGDFVLLLGANGVGKTTLLRICVGLSRADRGLLSYANCAVGAHPMSEIGHSGHELMLYDNLTLSENLKLIAGLMNIEMSVQEHIESWKLGPCAGKPLSELSRGLQYRASLCRMFLGDPHYMFLDEPTSSLDEASLDLFVRNVRKRLQSGPEECFALVATHDVMRLLEAASRIIVLHDGVIARDTLLLQEADSHVTLDQSKQAVIDFYRSVNR